MDLLQLLTTAMLTLAGGGNAQTPPPPQGRLEAREVEQRSEMMEM